MAEDQEWYQEALTGVVLEILHLYHHHKEATAAAEAAQLITTQVVAAEAELQVPAVMDNYGLLHKLVDQVAAEQLAIFQDQV